MAKPNSIPHRLLIRAQARDVDGLIENARSALRKIRSGATKGEFKHPVKEGDPEEGFLFHVSMFSRYVDRTSESSAKVRARAKRKATAALHAFQHKYGRAPDIQDIEFMVRVYTGVAEYLTEMARDGRKQQDAVNGRKARRAVPGNKGGVVSARGKTSRKGSRPESE